jgi:hypothetical protein
VAAALPARPNWAPAPGSFPVNGCRRAKPGPPGTVGRGVRRAALRTRFVTPDQRPIGRPHEHGGAGSARVRTRSGAVLTPAQRRPLDPSSNGWPAVTSAHVSHRPAPVPRHRCAWSLPSRDAGESVVVDVLGQERAQVPLVEGDGVVEALPPERADLSFGDGIGTGRSDWREHGLQSERCRSRTSPPYASSRSRIRCIGRLP